MLSKTSIILNSHNLRAGASLNLTEWTDYSWASELTFIIDVQQTLGSPTAGTLSAKFQKRVPHKTGSIQFANQRLVDLAVEEKASWLVEGDWPPILADFSLATTASFQRTVRNFGPGINLNLATAGLAGGTSPGFQVSALVIAKGAK